MPGHVLVDLLRGEAPVLKHDAQQATMAWDPRGYWVLDHPLDARQAREEIHLAPRPEDWSLPWEQQRMRVLDVRVVQQGYELYHAELDDHAGAPTAGPREDPGQPRAAPAAERPGLRRRGPAQDPRRGARPAADVRLQYEHLTWNPPLPEGTFVQQAPPGMRTEAVDCE